MGELIDASGFGSRDECCTYISMEGSMGWLEHYAA